MPHDPPGKHGDHPHSLETFGLTSRDVHERYAAYIDYFGVEREGPG